MLCFACAEMLSAPTRARADASQTWRNCSLHILSRNTSPPPRRSPISTAAYLAATQSGGLCARATRRRDFSRDARGAGGTESGSLFSRVQADDRNVTTAVRDARADHSSRSNSSVRTFRTLMHVALGSANTIPSRFTKVFPCKRSDAGEVPHLPLTGCRVGSFSARMR
jgi:hypothetical protein